MATTVHCDIVSAEESMFSGLVEMVVAAGTEGDLGITPGHAALLTALRPGPVRVIKQGGDEEVFYVSSGFLEVQPGIISILSDSAQRAGDMDEAAALEAKKAAEKALVSQAGDFDYAAAASKLVEAAARLRTIKQMRKKK